MSKTTQVDDPRETGKGNTPNKMDGYQTPLEARGRLNREANLKAISQSLLWRREGDKTDRVKTSRRDAGQA